MKRNYIVVCECKTKAFEDDVNAKIDEGYVPCGGVFIEHIEYKTFIVQPMILAEVARASLPRTFSVPSSQKLVDAISDVKIEVRPELDSMRFYKSPLSS